MRIIGLSCAHYPVCIQKISLRSPELRKMFEVLPEVVARRMGITRPEIQTSAVVKL